MIGIEWARASQFNWTFDNMGGTPLQEVVSGLWSGVSFTVHDNTITIPQTSGGGQVYYLRGVWSVDALFAWAGFWVEPETGDTNYFIGGSFENIGNETVVTLGTGLANGTQVQAYYVYNTGEKAAKYDSINSTPCMRQAWRSATDYTYDFAVDRIFDAIAAVYFAYKEQGLDPSDILEFFWKTYIDNAASNSSPLVLDNFDRGFYDKGSYLLYFDSTDGQTGFDQFGTQLPPDDLSLGRALRFKPAYYQGSAFSAWFGYGFNWDLTQQYFDTISKVKIKVRGAGNITRVQKFIKTAGAGTTNMIMVDGFDLLVAKYYLVTVQTAGAPGTATLLLQRYNADLELENDADPDDDIDGEIIRSATSTGPVQLGHGIKAYWEDGALSVGDVWYITCGNQEIKPHRMLVTLNDSVPADPDPWGEEHSFFHGICDYYQRYQEFEIDFSQFWRLGNIIDCRDRRPGRWGNWSNHYFSTGTPYEMLFYDVDDEEVIGGETFYTKQRFTWNLSPATLLALGFYVGIPAGVDSTGATTINYFIKQGNGADQTIRTKVRDANGNYFYHDDVIGPGYWVRNTINLSDFLPVAGGVLTHPLTLVDIGLPDLTGKPGSTLSQGSFDLVDLKFDNHITFAGSNNLRIVEFKYQENSLVLQNGPDWYIDDFGFDISVDDAYPYVPRLAISLNAYGRNPWRGPTLVHYSHPLAPYLMNRFDMKNTELRFHTDAQNEFYARYAGVKGPIMPVHTRNDIENIALCGEENFNKFCWWPDYPETAYCLGQFWAFYRLAEYYFVSSDAGAWTILNNWLTWLDTYVVAEGAGWKFPIWWGDEFPGGFKYDTGSEFSFDAGAAGSLVVGALYIYMRNGDSRALVLAQRLLEDLRLYRASGDYGGYLYKSDYHYAWMNALVAHAFGMAVVGRAGAAYQYPFTASDETHFAKMMDNFWKMSGDSKPNLLNSELIPFHDCEPHDIWDYAPDYLFMKEMGSMEGVVLMMHAALDWALYSGSYHWFNVLLEFMIRLGQGTLGEQQIYKVTSNFMTTQVATKVNLSYGDYRRDNTLFVEEKDQRMIDLLGEIRTSLAMHYGSPVITEDANTARKIASRILEYFATPKEQLQVVADLAAARLDLNDVVKVQSQFHGFENDDFLLTRRLYDKKKLRVILDLMRNVNYSPSWAVDVAGGAYDSYAINTNSDRDANWTDRAYGN